MTPAEFRVWRTGMGFSQTAAAAALGISKSSVELYELGHRKDDGRPVIIPRTVALACAAIAAGLAPLGET